MIYDPVRYAAGFPPDLVDSDKNVKHKQIEFADLHGNAFCFLMRLEAHGILELTPQQRIDLAAIYRDSDNLTDTDWDKFEDILKQVIVNKDKTRHLLLLGDVLGDRGKNDILTLLILQRLLEGQVKVNIIFSNHDLEFLMWYLYQRTPIYLMNRHNIKNYKISNYLGIYLYSSSKGLFINSSDGFKSFPDLEEYRTNPSKKLTFNQPENNPQPLENKTDEDKIFSHRVLPILYDTFTPKILTGDIYKRSLLSLIKFSNRFPQCHDRLLNLIDTVYRPILILKDYSLNLKPEIPVIRLDTHAPSGPESIESLAEFYKVKYDDSTAETFFNAVNKINRHFSQATMGALQNILYTEMTTYITQVRQAEIDGKPFNLDPKIFPHIYGAWNREDNYLDEFTHENLSMINDHGHQGQGLTPWRRDIFTTVGNNRDYKNFLGHMFGSEYGASSDSLCSFVNDEDDILSMEWIALFPSDDREDKEEKASTVDAKKMLSDIKDEIQTTTWLTSGGMPSVIENMLTLIKYSERFIITNKTALHEVQKWAEKSKMTNPNSAFFNDEKFKKIRDFYNKFNEGGMYSLTPDTPPSVTIKINDSPLSKKI